MMTQDQSKPQVVALVRDLMFSSRISGLARAAGTQITLIREASRLAESPEAAAATLLIVDLNQDGAIPAAAAWRQQGAGRMVLGFVSHVDAATIASARSAGIDRIVARSGFAAELESMLRAESPPQS